MWISVKDKLPALDEEVLVISYANDYYLAWRSYYNGIEEWNSDEGTFEDDYITHWQPLPPLPQDEQQVETEMDIKHGISEQSKKWQDGCENYNQERINKLAEEIKAKQKELDSLDCQKIKNIIGNPYKVVE